MAPINVLVSGLPFKPSTLCLPVGDESSALHANTIADAVVAATGLPRTSFFLRTHNSLLHPCATVTVPGQHTAFVTLCLRRALPGGRGGFGALLEEGPASKYSTTIQSFCQLSSLRERYVKHEQVLREYLGCISETEDAVSRRMQRKRVLESDEKHLCSHSEIERTNSQRAAHDDVFASPPATRVCRKRPRVFTSYAAGYENEELRNDEIRRSFRMTDAHDAGLSEDSPAESVLSRFDTPVNVVVSGLPCDPSSLCLKVGCSSIPLQACTVQNAICEATGLPQGSFVLRANGSLLHPSAMVAAVGQHTAFVSIFMRRALPGGKGGFGAMLRGSGSTKKTTNFDACRDLQGRRLRHVRDEQALRQYLQEKREGGSAEVAKDVSEAGPSSTGDASRKRTHEEEESVPSVDLGKVEDEMDRVSRSVSDAVEDALAGSFAVLRKRRRLSTTNDESATNGESEQKKLPEDDWLAGYDVGDSSDDDGSDDEGTRVEPADEGEGSSGSIPDRSDEVAEKA